MASIGGTGGDHLPIGHKHVERTDSSETLRPTTGTDVSSTAKKVESVAISGMIGRPAGLTSHSKPTRGRIPPQSHRHGMTVDEVAAITAKKEAFECLRDLGLSEQAASLVIWGNTMGHVGRFTPREMDYRERHSELLSDTDNLIERLVKHRESPAGLKTVEADIKSLLPLFESWVEPGNSDPRVTRAPTLGERITDGFRSLFSSRSSSSAATMPSPLIGRVSELRSGNNSTQ